MLFCTKYTYGKDEGKKCFFLNKHSEKKLKSTNLTMAGNQKICVNHMQFSLIFDQGDSKGFKIFPIKLFYKKLCDLPLPHPPIHPLLALCSLMIFVWAALAILVTH